MVSNMHLPSAEVALAADGAVGDAREEAAAADTRRRSSIAEDFIVYPYKIASWRTRRVVAAARRREWKTKWTSELSFFFALSSTTRSRRRKAAADGLGPPGGLPVEWVFLCAARREGIFLTPPQRRRSLRARARPIQRSPPREGSKRTKREMEAATLDPATQAGVGAFAGLVEVTAQQVCNATFLFSQLYHRVWAPVPPKRSA